MRKGFLGALGAWLAGAGLALAQPAPEFRPAQGFTYPGAPQVYSPSASMVQQSAMAYPGYVQQPAMVYQPPAMVYQQPIMYQRPIMYTQSMMYPRTQPYPYVQANYARPMPMMAATPGQPQGPAVPYLNTGPAIIPSGPAAVPTLPTMPAADEKDTETKSEPAAKTAPAESKPVSSAPADLPEASKVMSSAAAPASVCDDNCDRCYKGKEKKHTFSWPKITLFSKKEKVEKATLVTEECPQASCTPCGKKCKSGKKCDKCGKKCDDCTVVVEQPAPAACATCTPSCTQGCATWCPPCPCARAGGVPPCAACGMPCAQNGMACGAYGAGCSPGCDQDDTHSRKHIILRMEEDEEQCVPHCWFSFEYLQWLVKDEPIASPLLVAGSTVLLGGSDLEFDSLRGGRFTAGFRYDTCLAFETTLLGMERGTFNESISSSTAGVPALFRPQVDAGTGATTLVPVAVPGLLSGGTTLDARTRLYGGDTNLVYTLCTNNTCALNLLAGFRYLYLEENLNVREESQGVLVLFDTTSSDKYSTKNRFYGGQLGLQAAAQCGKLYASASGKIAAGATQERLSETGLTTLTTLFGTTTTSGGINVRTPQFRDETEFSFVPEGTLEIGFQICPHVSATFGYTFLYWNKVARPGDQVSNVINSPVTSARITDNTFWAQAISGGLAFRY